MFNSIQKLLRLANGGAQTLEKLLEMISWKRENNGNFILMQGILIGLVTAFCYSGMLLEFIQTEQLLWRFVGLILGDIPTALTFGALAELAYGDSGRC